MAAVTHQVALNSTANSTSYATAAFTPTASGLLFVSVCTVGTAAATPTLTGSANGMGFDLLSVQATSTGGGNERIYSFVADAKTPGSPASMTLTFDCTGDSASGCFIIAESVSFISRVGSGVGGAIKQVIGVDEVPSGTAPSTVFDNAVQTGNPTVFTVASVNTGGSTPPSGWTEQYDDLIATPAAAASLHSRNSGFTGTTITLGNTVGQCCAVAVEFDNSTTGTTFAAAGVVACTSAVVGNATRTLQVRVAAGVVPVVCETAGSPTRTLLTLAASGTAPVVTTLVGDVQRVFITYAASGVIPAVTGVSGDAVKLAAGNSAVGTVPVVSDASGNPTRVPLALVAAGVVALTTTVAGGASRSLPGTGTSALTTTVVGNVTAIEYAPTGEGVVAIVSTVSGGADKVDGDGAVLLRLVLNWSVDDHQRPVPRLWSGYAYQPTQTALLLFMDGTVIPTDTLYSAAYEACDDVAAGGHDSIYRQDSWQVDVLSAAGYWLVPVT